MGATPLFPRSAKNRGIHHQHWCVHLQGKLLLNLTSGPPPLMFSSICWRRINCLFVSFSLFSLATKTVGQDCFSPNLFIWRAETRPGQREVKSARSPILISWLVITITGWLTIHLSKTHRETQNYFVIFSPGCQWLAGGCCWSSLSLIISITQPSPA